MCDRDSSFTFRTPPTDFCYYFGMPALLVRTIATAPPGSTAAHLIWISYLLPVAAIWILASLFARQDRSNSGSEAPAIAMASAYGNVIMLGISLAFAQFGPKAATTIAFIVLVHSPVLFLLAAIGVIAVISSLKLAVMPFIAFVLAARLFHLPPTDVAIVTLLSAMPTGANACVFARRSGKAEASVSGAVALSTMASIVTITTVVAMLARAE